MTDTNSPKLNKDGSVRKKVGRKEGYRAPTKVKTTPELIKLTAEGLQEGVTHMLNVLASTEDTATPTLKMTAAKNLTDVGKHFMTLGLTGSIKDETPAAKETKVEPKSNVSHLKPFKAV